MTTKKISKKENPKIFPMEIIKQDVPSNLAAWEKREGGWEWIGKRGSVRAGSGWLLGEEQTGRARKEIP